MMKLRTLTIFSPIVTSTGSFNKNQNTRRTILCLDFDAWYFECHLKLQTVDVRSIDKSRKQKQNMLIRNSCHFVCVSGFILPGHVHVPQISIDRILCVLSLLTELNSLCVCIETNPRRHQNSVHVILTSSKANGIHVRKVKPVSKLDSLQ